MPGRRSRRAAGRTFACGSQAVGGYPFRIEVRCTRRFGVELKDAQPPIAIKLKEILVVAQVWDPKLLIAEFTGPLTASDPGAAALCHRDLDAGAGERARHAGGAGARLDRGRRSEARWRRAGHAAVRCQACRVSRARAVRLVAAQSGDRSCGEARGRERARGSTRSRAQPLDADILAVLHGMKDFAPKPLPVRLREWQAAGGRLEIQNARLAQGESLAQRDRHARR